MGCAIEAYASNALVVVTRPEKVLYPEYAALVTSFGTGTVVSVEAPYLDWVNANRPKNHWGAFNFSFLAGLAAEVERAGSETTGRSVALGFVPSEDPGAPQLPAGFSPVERGSDWMAEWRPRDQFTNSVGEQGEDDWAARLVKAFVILDASGEPAACATLADDGNGCGEIGLDVRRAWRAQGLARPVTLAATRWALATGLVPYYTCGAANVRSHLVAESCGFRALWTVSGLARVAEGVGSQVQ